jgi:CheY-like chemotaxis protein
MMLDEPAIDGRNRDDVAEIHAAAKRAAALTRQLLAFSRRQVIAPRILRIQDTLAALQPMLARLIGEHVAIAIAPSAAASVRADPSQVEQIILNLALNARDAMPAGGTLSFAVDEVALHAEERLSSLDLSGGNYVRLIVSDTGVGMSPETMAQVFEPFFTTKPIGQGTGLGLATVHGAVKQNHGAIEVRSELHRGTSFVVYLPRVDGPVHEAEAEPPPSLVGVGRATVLIVEDEDGVRKLAQRVLEKAGYQVLMAASPSAALDIAEVTGPIDLLLSDIVLPEMSGTALAEKVRQFHPGIKVLFMSGYTDDMIVRHGLSDRTIALVEKPFTPETLLRMVYEISRPPA